MNLDLALEAGKPVRRQLEQALRDAIRSGRLQPDAMLPPSRVLAEQLGISRGVVVDSYSQLVTEGYLSARQGSGTRVAHLPTTELAARSRRLPAPERFRYDLRPGQADFHAFPRAGWQRALMRAMRELPDMRLTYGPPRGAPELRNALAEHLGRVRGVIVDPATVTVCTSVSHGLSVVWQVLRRRGARRVAIEDPGWRWQRLTVERSGLEAVPIRVDGGGLDVEQLVAAGVDAVVVTAAHQYPMGVALAADRRRALVSWARERGTLIVEDDYDVEYRFDRQPLSALQGMAPDHVAFVGTASKTLAPALRLGWLVPPPQLADEVEHELLVTGLTPSTIDQMALATFIADSGLERHLRRMRQRYAKKRDFLLEALGRHLPGATASGISAGLHVLVWLPEGADEERVARFARARDVGVHELHRHFTTVAPRPSGLVLGYALPTEAELEVGVRVLGEAVGNAGRHGSRPASRPHSSHSVS
jgi:GntR family transcriptional regulator/MocR family aminotransferase